MKLGVTRYTKAVTKGLFDSIKQDLEEDSIDHNYIYIGQLLTKYGLYKELFSRLRERYQNNKGISQTVKWIMDELESRVVVGAMKGKLNPATTIFHLKNNYKWTDQQQINVIATQGTPLLNEEQIKKIASRALTKRVLTLKPSSVNTEISPQ